MKKAILVGLMLFVLLFSAAVSVVSCTPKPETDPNPANEQDSNGQDPADPGSNYGDNESDWPEEWN